MSRRGTRTTIPKRRVSTRYDLNLMPSKIERCTGVGSASFCISLRRLHWFAGICIDNSALKAALSDLRYRVMEFSQTIFVGSARLTADLSRRGSLRSAHAKTRRGKSDTDMAARSFQSFAGFPQPDRISDSKVEALSSHRYSRRLCTDHEGHAPRALGVVEPLICALFERACGITRRSDRQADARANP